MNQKLYVRDFHSQFTPKKPSPRTPIDQATHDKIFNAGWNAAVAFYKELGKI